MEPSAPTPPEPPRGAGERRGRPPPSLRSRLLWLVAVMLAPVTGLSAYHGYRDIGRAERVAGERVLSVASEAAAGIQQFYDLSRRSVLRLSADFGPLLLRRESCLEAVAPAYAAVPYFANLVVFDARGDLVCAGMESGTTINVADRDWFVALESEAFAVGEPTVGRIIGTWVVGLAASIRVDGTFAGTVAGTIELRRFQDIIASLGDLEGGLLTVTTRGNVVMARSENPEAWIAKLLPTRPTEVSQIDEARAITRSLDAEGAPRIFGRVDLPGPGWRVFVGIPEEVAFAEAKASLRRELLVMLTLMTITFGFALSIQGGISRSLEALAAGVRGVADGRPVEPPPGAPREVRDVADQINLAVAERRRAEHAAAATRERLDSLIDNAVFGIVLVRDSKLQRANRAYARMLGYDRPEEIVGRPSGDAFVDQEALERIRAYPAGSILRNEEVRLRTRDGSARLARMNGRVEGLPDGGRSYELIIEDITKERELEEITRHQQKMDAVGRLAGGVAHEFNNLLTVMGINAEFLREEIDPHAPARGEVDQIGTAVDRAKSLTRKLLAFSRREIVQPTLVDLSATVADFQAMLRKVIPEHVAIDIDLGDRVGPVHIDVLQVEQALLNLVINARDAMPGGGRVHIRTERREEPDEQVASELAADAPRGPWGVLTVEDDGPGIDDTMKSLVFEPFFTTKPPGEGTGLGLPTVYGIVSEAGGHLTLESQLGVGTRIRLWLPIVTG